MKQKAFCSHSCQRVPNTAILWRFPYIACYPFFIFFPTSFSPCSFCCLVSSLGDYVIILHLMCYFTYWYDSCTCSTLIPYYQKHLAMCFMQLGINFILGVTHHMAFASTVIWYHTQTNKHIAHTEINGVIIQLML